MSFSHTPIAALLRADFASFIHRSFSELNPQTAYLDNGHIELIAWKLEQVRRGILRRLIINLPPRHLKSHCASVAFPAWCLGHDPSLQLIVACYGQELVEKFARDNRTLMTSKFYQDLFPTRLSNRLAVHDFTTTKGGGRMSTSVGGVLTGRGADIIIIDDPLKPDEALSDSRRTAVNEWFDHTLLSRLNNKETGSIVIIMQRLHMDDVVGHVLDQGPWEVVNLPAIAEADEAHAYESLRGPRFFRRKAGQPLHAARESLDSLNRTRAAVGEYIFQSQYQQQPMPLGGAMVKRHWLRFYEPSDLPQRFTMVLQSWDTAVKAHELADYSVCTTWGVLDRRLYLLDVIRERLEFPDLERRAEEHAKRYPGCKVLIEDKSSGSQLIQVLQSKIFGGVIAHKPPPGTDKVMRLHAQTSFFENGLVFLPSQAPWLGDYITELLSFPGSKHDDQVDATTQALEHLRVPDKMAIWAKLAE